MTEPTKPESAEPTPELPEAGADLEPQAQPLAHDEPPAAHSVEAERAIAGEPHAMGEATPNGHIDEHAAGDAHDHEDARLGPIDWPVWGYALLGAVVALVVVGAFVVAAYLN